MKNSTHTINEMCCSGHYMLLFQNNIRPKTLSGQSAAKFMKDPFLEAED